MTVPAFPTYGGNLPNRRTMTPAEFNVAADAYTAWLAATLGAGADAFAAALPTEAASTLQGSSTSSVSIGTGSKVFSIADKAFAAGMWVTAHDANAPSTNYMIGQVASYTSGTLTITVPTGGATGSGTFTDWDIYLSGQIGATGPAGPGSGDALVANPLSQFAATTSAQLAGVISDETGSGSLVFATAPVLVTPNLGTPTAITLSNATGLPVSTGISGLGTGVATALAVNVGSAGAFVTFNGAGGTPSSLTLTNATGLPVSTGIGGLGTGVATALAIAANGAGGFVTNTGTATLTNKTLPNPTINDAEITEPTQFPIYTISDGASVAIDPANGATQKWTLGASRTAAVNATWEEGQEVTLLVDDGTAYTLDLDTNVVDVWRTDGGVAPTLNTTGWTEISLKMLNSEIVGARIGDA